MTVLRIPFSEVFRENADGSLTLLQTIKVNDAELNPTMTLNKGVVIGGVDFFQFKGFPIAAEQEGNILVIKGYFPPND